jgi:osmotically-inducible protein OsmY
MDKFHKPNHVLESDVRDELDWDPMVDNSQIMVKASDGAVTLTGAVPTYYDSSRASEDVWTVGGVKNVENKLLVGRAGEKIVDAEVAAACMKALEGDRFVPHGAVKVDVLDGWATLSGTVRRHSERKAAEYAVRQVAGVRGITEDIAISGDPIPSDVSDRINKAFRRNAIVDDSLIKVSNSGHTIYLDGETGSWVAKEVAENIAWNAPGVHDVENRLVIIPS